MKHTLLPKPVMRQASTVQRSVSIVNVNTPDPRLSLKPYWNQQVLVQATVDVNTFRYKRSFCLLTDVKVAPFSDRLKREEDRCFVPVHHSWIEQTQVADLCEPGSTIYFPAVVISYQRADGSWSYGFRNADCVGAGDVLAYHCGDLYLALVNETYVGSMAGAIQAAEGVIIKELRSGIDAIHNQPIVYSQYGRASFIKFVQGNFRNLVRMAKRNDFAEGWDWLKHVALREFQAKSFANPLLNP